jgi:hypothetical protein
MKNDRILKNKKGEPTFAEQMMNADNLSGLDPSFHSPCPCKVRN